MTTDGFRLYLVRQGLAKRTVKQHLSRAETLIEKCQPFNFQNCENHLAHRMEKGISGSTVNKYVQTIHKLVDFLELNWDKNVTYVKEQSKPRVLFTDEEIEAFISLETNDYTKETTQKWSVFWKLLAYTGARPSEIRTLTINDIDLSSKLIIIKKSKTGKGRVVPIAPVIINDVKDYIKTLSGDYVFPNGDSDCVSSNSYLKDFHNSLKAMRENLEKDPLMRGQLDPAKLVEDLVKIVKTLFSKDKRFKVSIQQKEGKLKIEITW